MGRPYGKTPKSAAEKQSASRRDTAGLKVKLRGRDGVPLSMTELQQALYELARKLKPHGDLRAKWATVYLTLVDENGEEVAIDAKSEWTIYPYKSAADEHGA
jgi:hypothetical protein